MTESKDKALTVKSDVTTVAVRNDVVENKKPKRKILDEDQYIESLEKIIQRDFFPDVSKLQAQKDYMEAEENGDLERMREISIKYVSVMAKYTPRTYVPYTTPSTFETPDGRSASPSCSQSKHRAVKGDGKDAEKTEEKDLPSLDCFLAKNTSEDNALTPKGLSPAALSPALQRLVNRSSSKYTDKALRASYTRHLRTGAWALILLSEAQPLPPAHQLPEKPEHQPHRTRPPSQTTSSSCPRGGKPRITSESKD